MQVLQNMILKDIISRKVINNELLLLKTNIESLALSQQMVDFDEK